MFFKPKSDRRVLEITIEFNLEAISKWLNLGGKFEDIEKIPRDWKNPVSKKYVIDMLPIGEESNAYLHRNLGVISQNIAGVDFLDAVNGNEKYFTKDKDVEMLSWDLHGGRFRLIVDYKEKGNVIFLTPPLTEVIELENTGKLKPHEKSSNDLRKAMTEEIEIPIPCSDGKNNEPIEYAKVWRYSGNNKFLRYSNALGRVSFVVQDSPVKY